VESSPAPYARMPEAVCHEAEFDGVPVQAREHPDRVEAHRLQAALAVFVQVVGVGPVEKQRHVAKKSWNTSGSTM